MICPKIIYKMVQLFYKKTERNPDYCKKLIRYKFKCWRDSAIWTM